MLITILNYIHLHWIAFSAISGYLFMAAVESFPIPGDPRPVSQKLYQWIYDFLHIIANKMVERQPNLAPIVTIPSPAVYVPKTK